jgi:hypothetical protein
MNSTRGLICVLKVFSSMQASRSREPLYHRKDRTVVLDKPQVL